VKIVKTTNRISYFQLDAVLKDLGFRKKVVLDSGVAYTHPSTGTPIAVPAHKSSETVPDYVMAGTRLQLDRHGVVEAKDFDQMLKAAVA